MDKPSLCVWTGKKACPRVS